MRMHFKTIMTATKDPFYCYGLTVIPVRISNHIHQIVWDEITYPSANFNGRAVEVWEWISNLIQITYPSTNFNGSTVEV